MGGELPGEGGHSPQAPPEGHALPPKFLDRQLHFIGVTTRGHHTPKDSDHDWDLALEEDMAPPLPGREKRSLSVSLHIFLPGPPAASRLLFRAGKQRRWVLLPAPCRGNPSKAHAQALDTRTPHPQPQARVSHPPADLLHHQNWACHWASAEHP